MILLYVLSCIVITSIAYILFAPIYIEIDSNHAIYRVRFHTLFSLSFFVNNEPALVEVKAGFWKRRIDLSNAPGKEKRATAEKKPRPKGTFPLRKLTGVMRSFRVTRLNATFDLGDMKLNGMLYPLFYWLSFQTGKKIEINFEGRNSISLQIKNNIARMSRAYFCS